MIRKSLILATGLVFSLFSSSLNLVNAEELKTGKCTITITTDNVNGNYAHATGPCKGYIWGWYVPSDGSFIIDGSVTTEVHNGQKLKFGLPPTAGDYYDYELTVTTIIKEQPKPEPPKEEKPKPEPPKKEPSPKPQQPPKNDEPSKPSNPKDTSKPKDNGNKPQPSKPSEPKEIKTNPKQKTSKENVKENVNVVKGNNKVVDEKEASKWTTKDLKEKNAVIEEKGGKLFAKVDGVYKEVTKEQAEELGYKEEQDKEDEETATETDQEQGIQNNQEENGKQEKQSANSKEAKNSNAIPIAVGTTVVAGATIGGLYYFHPSSREVITKIIEYILKLFKK